MRGTIYCPSPHFWLQGPPDTLEAAIALCAWQKQQAKPAETHQAVNAAFQQWQSSGGRQESGSRSLDQLSGLPSGMGLTSMEQDITLPDISEHPRAAGALGARGSCRIGRLRCGNHECFTWLGRRLLLRGG